MTGNPTPWLLLFAVVVATLVFKGYIRLPSSLKRSSSSLGVAPTKSQSDTTYGAASPSEAFLLERLGSDTLGVYFALAKRREAEAEIAHKIASDAGEAIKATFTAPFSPPPAAGQDQASGNP